MIGCIKTGWPALLTWTRATFSSLILAGLDRLLLLLVLSHWNTRLYQ